MHTDHSKFDLYVLSIFVIVKHPTMFFAGDQIQLKLLYLLFQFPKPSI
ncbi:hypothetical protein URS_2952 [Acinetobacter ursingii]|nr:hypothetical protein URS_2952 [Acinetobacter ursingii]